MKLPKMKMPLYVKHYFFFVCKNSHAHLQNALNICSKFQNNCLKTLRGVDHTIFLTAQQMDGQMDRDTTKCPLTIVMDGIKFQRTPFFCLSVHCHKIHPGLNKTLQIFMQQSPEHNTYVFHCASCWWDKNIVNTVLALMTTVL